MLINTVEEIQQYLPVSVATSFDTIKPFIESSERKFIKPVLGYDAYTKLVGYYTAQQNSGSWGSSQEDSDAYADVLKLAQKALINLAYYHGFSILSVQATDGGFHRIESAEFKGLYKYQEEDLKDLFKKDGYNGIDDLLEYLEENIEYFPEFEDSENRLIDKANIIPDTKTMNSIYYIGGSRMVFLRLRYFMAQVEHFAIKKLLGATLYNFVKSELTKAEPAARVVALLPYLQKPVAFLTVAAGIEELGINVTDKMLFFESQMGTILNSSVKTPANADQLGIVKDKANKTGNSYLEDLKAFLIANETTYTEYSGQSGYIYARDNTDKKTFFAG
jgi:hypothetical protein